MDKRVIFAVAGSGKTTYIINQLNVDSKAIIVTYTINNTKFNRDINYNGSSFPCVVEVLKYNGEGYDDVYEFMENCYEVIK